MDIRNIFPCFQDQNHQISFKDFLEIFNKNFDINDFIQIETIDIIDSEIVVINSENKGLTAPTLSKEIYSICNLIAERLNRNTSLISVIQPENILISSFSIGSEMECFNKLKIDENNIELTFHYSVRNIRKKENEKVTYKRIYHIIKNYLKTQENKRKIKSENITPFLNMSNEDFYSLFKCSLVDSEILKEIRKIRESHRKPSPVRAGI